MLCVMRISGGESLCPLLPRWHTMGDNRQVRKERAKRAGVSAVPPRGFGGRRIAEPRAMQDATIRVYSAYSDRAYDCAVCSAQSAARCPPPQLPPASLGQGATLRRDCSLPSGCTHWWTRLPGHKGGQTQQRLTSQSKSEWPLEEIRGGGQTPRGSPCVSLRTCA